MSEPARWDTKHPYVILKFENAALCTNGLAKLNGKKRQRVKTSADHQLNHTLLAPLLACRANLGLPSSNGVANFVSSEPH